MSRSPRLTRPLLALAVVVSSSTGVVAVATPAHAVSPPDVVATARAEVGTPEGSARADSYGAAVHLYDSTHNYAWCAVFVSWVVERTGASRFRSASVGDWVAMAGAQSFGLSITETPQAGDLVAFDWDGNGDFAYPNRHVGVVASVRSNGRFTTIEGNTSLPSGGEGVAKKARSTVNGYSTLFIRIGVGSGGAAGLQVINSDPAR